MSIQIDSRTNTDSTATTKVTDDKKDSRNLVVGHSTSETVVAQTDRVTLSGQGLELAKSAAGDPYSSMSYQELAKKADSILRNMGRTTDALVVIADKEVPNSNDPERLARAKQATEYMYYRAPSPFAGYSRKELTEVIYNDTGAYTANERVSALRDQQAQDTQFWLPKAQKAEASGDYREVFEAALAFYDQLSPLEQAAYPVDYKMQISRQLQQENNKVGGEIDKDQKSSLLEMIRMLDKKKNNQGPNSEEDRPGEENAGDTSWSTKLAKLALSVEA